MTSMAMAHKIGGHCQSSNVNHAVPPKTAISPIHWRNAIGLLAIWGGLTATSTCVITISFGSLIRPCRIVIAGYDAFPPWLASPSPDSSRHLVDYVTTRTNS